MKTKPANFFTVEDENGNIIKEIPMTEADADWIRAGRLRRKAMKGDEEAAKEIKKMQITILDCISKEDFLKKDS